MWPYTSSRFYVISLTDVQDYETLQLVLKQLTQSVLVSCLNLVLMIHPDTEDATYSADKVSRKAGGDAMKYCCWYFNEPFLESL